MSAQRRVPLWWFIRTAWVVPRSISRVSGGRLGLSVPQPGRYGMMRPNAIRRRSGQERVAVVACVEADPRWARWR
ncbi:MAG: hypothetical protein ACK5IN_05630 [Microbacterium sp.]|uniref:hypothetical protein n=1 Tax=Microbacterium sp. TaxID=51671 RepID=UPI003A8515B9